MLTTLELPDLPYLFASLINPDTIEVPEPKVLRTIAKSDENLQLLWSHSDLSVPPISTESAIFEIKMVAANGVLAYVGRRERSLFREVLVLNVKDGKTVLWRTDGPGMGPNKLYATSSALYIGSSGDGKVAAYDLRTGEELWSKSFLFQRTVTHLQVVDNLVYVETVSNSKFLLQPDTGEEIWSWASAPNFNDEYFFLDSKTLTKDIEFSNNSGMVYATDRQTGDILWKTGVPIAHSNLVATDTAVYLVTGVPTEVKLLGVEPGSGKIINTVTFEPTTQVNYVGSNQVAVDEDLGILYVFLGASRQLFAFKIVNYSGHQP